MAEQLGLFAPKREAVDLRPLAGPHLPYTGGFAGLDEEFKRRSEEIWARNKAWREAHPPKGGLENPAHAPSSPPVAEAPKPAAGPLDAGEVGCLFCHRPTPRVPGQSWATCGDCQARHERAGWVNVAREQLAGKARAEGHRTHCPRCTALAGACLTCTSAVETDPSIRPCAVKGGAPCGSR